MKTSIKTFACAFVASVAFVAFVAFVSCSNGGEQHSQEASKDGPGNVACKGSYTPNFDYHPDLDPACKSEDREYIQILDVQKVVFEVDGASYSINDGLGVSEEMEKCAKGINYNDEYISWRKLDSITSTDGELKEAMRGEVEAYNERYGICVEAMNSEARDISIPCELNYHRNSRLWEAMLTEEEIAELKNKYDDISITHIYMVPAETDDGVGGSGSGSGGDSKPTPRCNN